MIIVFIGDTLCNKTVREECRKAGRKALFFRSKDLLEPLKADIAVVSNDHGDQGLFAHKEALRGVPVIAALGMQGIISDVSTLSPEDNERINRYFAYGGEGNVKNALLMLERLAGSDAGEESPPTETFFDAIYTPDGKLYRSADAYFESQGRRFDKYIGMLSYRARYAESDTAVENAIIRAFGARGVGVIAAYSAGTPDPELGCLPFEDVLGFFFRHNGRPIIDALINFEFFGARGDEVHSMFQRAQVIFERLDIPVIKPVISSRLTRDQWEESLQPTSADMALHYHIPEMQGIIEPIWIGCAGGKRFSLPVEERVSRLADRIVRWISLRRKANREKRVVVMLHSAVCSGVEATIGRASGLDAFESVARLLARMRAEGYAVKSIPENGEALRQMIFEKKTYAEFRWTGISDIVKHGGALYYMSSNEYRGFYNRLPAKARDQMSQSWGEPPGEAMVTGDHIVVTGLDFGNARVMVQPKRGCYGAKCTGEVCKILQDPNCPPSHHYLATYFYVRHIFNADACVHVGTHGSLEYLPGKATGLSESCFPDIAIGDLPNLYIFNANSASQGLTAKRRGYAVTVDHLPPPEGRDFVGYRHVLGQPPDNRASRDYIRTIRRGESSDPRDVDGADGLLEDAPATGEPQEELGQDALALRDLLRKSTDEMDALLHGLDGGYVPAGAAAGVSRATLPTGRNLHGLEADKLPTREAYEKGSRAADELIRKYANDAGKPPEKVAVTLSALDVTRTEGQQVCQFLAFLGVEPVWNIKGRVTGLSVLPLDRLGRPRVDVTAQISSIMRDAWPGLVKLLSEAVELAARQDEPDSLNPVRKNMREAGNSRIFGVAPGTYGNSIGLALKASAWRSETDLARYYLDSNSYVYGRDKHGEKNIEALVSNIRQTDAAYDVAASGRTDAVSSSYNARMQGGLAAATRYVQGARKLRHYMRESAPEGDRVVEFSEHVARSIGQTLLDEHWREQITRQGYMGASDLLSCLQNIFDTQCTLHNIPDTTLDEVALRCLCDVRVRDWFEAHNPFALEESVRRFLELKQRGKWKASPDVLKTLQESYLKAEGALEDEVGGKDDVQAGEIDIVTDSQVKDWATRMADVDARVRKMRPS